MCENAREKQPSVIDTAPVAEFLLIDPRITEGGVVDGPERTNKSHSKKNHSKCPPQVSTDAVLGSYLLLMLRFRGCVKKRSGVLARKSNKMRIDTATHARNIEQMSNDGAENGITRKTGQHVYLNGVVDSPMNPISIAARRLAAWHSHNLGLGSASDLARMKWKGFLPAAVPSKWP